MRKVTLVIGLHGNPGRGDFLEPLLPHLQAAGRKVELPTRPPEGASLEALLDDLERIVHQHDPEDLYLVGFSWGAFLAMHYALHGQARQPVGVALVSPVLVAEEPVGPLTRALLKTPGLGELLIRRDVEQHLGDHVERLLAPAGAPSEASERLREELSDLVLWAGAPSYQALLDQHPLEPLAEPGWRMLVIRGARDEVADWEVQRGPLAGHLPAIDTRVVEGAGHGLWWTHPGGVGRHLATWLGGA